VLDDILDGAIARGVTPGGILLVADAGAVVARTPFGHTHDGGPTVTADTVYDVASLTKPVVTGALLMKLVDAGTVALDAPARRWLPELAGDAAAITVRDLACHASGLPAHVELHERLLAGERLGAASAREAILRMTAATPLSYPTGTRALYSDLGFILLGFVLERAAGERLDALAARLVLDPLAMRRSQFVDLEATPPAPRPRPVAPTERCPYRGLVAGEVHDQNTHAAGGILGPAGLFSTADDLARFAAAIVAAAGGRATAGFTPDIVRDFFAPTAVPGTTWRTAWDSPAAAPGTSHAGDLWPRDGVGHLGFTGCSMWLDPPRGRFVILLTNAVHRTVERTGLRELRRAVMDGAVRALPP
jgi:CubicO group peptidase (beta-lactamase class C family)